MLKGRWTEGYAGALLRGGAFVGFWAVGSVLLSLGINTVLARQMGSAGLGEFSLVLTTAGLLSAVATLGQGPVLVGEIARVDRTERDGALWASISAVSAGLVVGALVLTSAFAHSILDAFAIPESRAVPLVLVSVSATLYLVIREVFRGLRRFGRASALGQPIQSVLMIGFLAAALSLDVVVTPELAVWALAGCACVSAIVAIAAFLSEVNWHTFHLRDVLRLVKMGLPLAIGSGFAFGLDRLPIWALGFENTLDEAGVYALAMAIYSGVNLLPRIGNNTIAPFIASDYKDLSTSAATLRFRRVAAVVSVSVILVSGLVLIAAVALGTSIFGTDFDGMASVLAILLSGAVARGLTGPCGLLLSVTGFQRFNLIASVASGALALVAVLVLTRSYGALGAAVGVAAANLLQNGLLWWFAYRHAGVRTDANFASLIRYMRVAD